MPKLQNYYIKIIYFRNKTKQKIQMQVSICLNIKINKFKIIRIVFYKIKGK